MTVRSKVDVFVIKDFNGIKNEESVSLILNAENAQKKMKNGDFAGLIAPSLAKIRMMNHLSVTWPATQVRGWQNLLES